MRCRWMVVGMGGLLLLGCPTPPAEPPEDEAPAEPVPATREEMRERGDERPQVLAGVQQLVAVLMPAEGQQARGTARFEQVDRGVRVEVRVEGLEQGGEHGFHVHAFGDCSDPAGESMGDHYDPMGHPHALPPGMPRHAGDMGNLFADENGVATLEETFGTMSLVQPPAPILGRALVVHGERDDGSQPDGDAGDAIACGVIGIAAGEGDPEGDDEG
jgi:superoxide dismutase, Cu-Zn family